MELIVLGCGGGWPAPGGAACGYLLSTDGYRLWVDLGTGTMANLQKHADLMDVDAVVVSHRHFDHFLDMYPFYLARWYAIDSPPIPLFAPPGMFEHALPLEEGLAKGFASTVVEPGETFRAGPFEVRTTPMQHPVPTLGMRFESGGKAIAYTADTGPGEGLVPLAEGADVLLSEATWLEVPAWAQPIHLTATQAGEAARKAGAGRLVVTHVWPTNPKDAVEERASAAFGGPVSLAVEGMKITP